MRSSVFGVNPSASDERLYSRMKQLGELPFTEFEVKEEFYHEKLEKLAVAGIAFEPYYIEYKQLDERITPLEKLRTFAKVYQIVFDALEVYSKSSKPAGADESNPIMMYLLLKSCPQHMYSTIK